MKKKKQIMDEVNGRFKEELEANIGITSSSQRTKNCWQSFFHQKTTLEKFLIILLLFSLLLILILILSWSFKSAAYLLGAMDTTADPCTDFFQYACGAWNRKHVIPEDRSSISTFEVMADQLQIILKGLLEEDHNEFDCEATLKVKNFYKSCMNICRSQIERISDTPLVQAINGLGGWPVVDPYWTSHNWTIERVIGILKKNFTLGIFIEEWVGPDDRNSSAHIIQIDQMTFGLPSRDYFLLEESDRDLKAYHIYMTEVGALLGANKTYAYEQFQNVIRFEKSIANISVPEHDRINTGAIYTKISLKDLKTEVPEINWNDYFDTVMGIGYIGDNEQIVSYSMPYFKLLGKLLKQTDKKIIHNYMIWRTVLELMPHLPPQYESTRAEFRRVLLGVLTGRIRWHKCVDWANKKMGMAVGALFIRDNFNYDSKEIALSMIHDIREAFNDLLEENEWMDEETRLVAKDKANSMNERIGYPEYITNKTRLNQEYENLSITPVNFLDNLFNILRFEASNNQRKLRLAVDKDKWQTEPAVVNAFYNPNKNDIVFPAGILQPLFYSQHFPKSLNYGGIGVVIGHEITHGFDDKDLVWIYATRGCQDQNSCCSSFTWANKSSWTSFKFCVHWIAPRRNSGCISFKAMVIERPGIWFMDDGALSYTVCEDSSALAEPQNVDPCCACNEAKYEIVFQGIWSRHTHPKNFPEDEWRTQFSTLIGASHSSNFSIWDYGEIASSALQELGENGITRPLESQMKQYSHTIRSVIKAHGLQQRSNVEGQTFAVFRVDKIHHLLSVVSKMIPSPDFIVGVSKENLCLSNCSWVPYRVVDLYPWDIGTDSGITYNDPPNPQRPKDIIKRITSNYPNDPKSPFFDISGAPIKPAARLHIIRQKTYKRSNCPLEMGYQTSSNPMNPSWINTFSKETNNNKKMTQNSFYQEDSTTLEQNNNNRSNKNIPLRFEFTGSSIHESSANNDIHSVKFSDNVLIPESNEDKNELYDTISCKKTEWEDWSKCSRTCGFGSRLRLRQFVNHSASKNSNCVDKNVEKEVCQNLPICSATRYGGNFDLFESGSQNKIIWDSKRNKDTLDISYVNHNINPNFINHEEKQSYEYPPRFDYMVKKLSYDEKSSKEMDCSLTNYGPWSDCSVSCGKGSKTRIRRYKEPSKSFECTKELYQINDCISNFCYGHQNSVYILKNKINNNKYNSSNKNPSCKISEWSSWSPCSKKCNQGYKIRTRLYLIPFVPNRSCDVKLMDRLNCNDAGLKCSSTASKDFDIFEDFTSIHGGKNREPIYTDESENSICKLSPDPGPCRGHYSRWYFNANDNNCQKFEFFGCDGNKNNFPSEEQCMETCYTHSSKDWSTYDRKILKYTLKNEMPMDQPLNDIYSKKSECKFEKWTQWSECVSPCRRIGWRSRIRKKKFVTHSSRCSNRIFEKKKCINTVDCFKLDHSRWYQGSWR
ncbi:uncharacterized protein [Lepeophtheirus salmonis]|uniref:uncharacterized protein isoform X5 n=1 Tax=Lepeophtheirus salmonis TaxID=72036 RepID=UPI003AF3B2C2